METIDTIIINRLGERQRKVDFIKRNLNRRDGNSFKFRKVGYIMLSVAACVAIIFVISPMLFKSDSISDISISTPSFTEYRGASLNNLESQINSGRYEEALLTVNAELNKIDEEMKSISSAEMSEQEANYMTALFNGAKEELMWSKIYILVKLDKEDDLRIVCQNYLRNSDFKEHKSEVDNILKKIQ